MEPVDPTKLTENELDALIEALEANAPESMTLDLSQGNTVTVPAWTDNIQWAGSILPSEYLMDYDFSHPGAEDVPDADDLDIAEQVVIEKEYDEKGNVTKETRTVYRPKPKDPVPPPERPSRPTRPNPPVPPAQPIVYPPQTIPPPYYPNPNYYYYPTPQIGDSWTHHPPQYINAAGVYYTS